MLWLCLFILSGVISPLISSSILGTYQPGVFIFQCPIFLPFHTVRGVLKARILKWFAIPFSSGPHSVRPLHHDPEGVARGHQRADTLKPYSQKTRQSNHTRTAALSNSMKLNHARGATQDGRVMVERSARMWSTGEGNGKPLQYSCLENPMNSMKRQNDRILNEELPRSVGAQYAAGDQWRNNSRKNEEMEPKQKQYPVADVTGDRSKV